MKTVMLFILLLNHYFVSAQQNNDDYKNGYIVKGFDSIKCKILYNKDKPLIWDKVTVLINGKDTTFNADWNADRTITHNHELLMFGIADGEINVHYGAVCIRDKNHSGLKYLFVKKLVTGSIELYEHRYIIYKTLRGTSNTTVENHTDYYIGKTQNEWVPEPFIIRSFNKKGLSFFLAEHEDLWPERVKKLSLEQLIDLLNKYNELEN